MKIRTIRETLNYVRQFRGFSFVVKLDGKVTEYARERGMFDDIRRIQQAGINIRLVHDNPALNLTDWELAGAEVKLLNASSSLPALINLPSSPKEPINFSDCDKLAADIAVQLNAAKLIYVTNMGGVFYPITNLLKELSEEQARALLEKPNAVTGAMRNKLIASIFACQKGVDRVHVISGKEGSLLQEIFTCDGMGTMIYSRKPYQQIRRAVESEIHEIVEIMRLSIPKLPVDLMAMGEEIKTFWVFAVDEDIHGCMQLIDNPQSESAEIACVATSSGYEVVALQRLLEYAVRHAKSIGRKNLLLNPDKNNPYLLIYPWFMQLGFNKESMPQASQFNKNAKVSCWTCCL